MEQKVRLSTVCLGGQGDLIKPDQIHVVNILPGFQTGVEELLTKTWIESWTTTSPQPRPAPRTPESAPSSATWICTVAASQDLCMGEDPSAQDGAGRVDQDTQTSEAPILSYPLPPALASGCPRPGPMRNISVAPCSCSLCRALAQMSTCGSATLMAGRKASESDCGFWPPSLPHS